MRLYLTAVALAFSATAIIVSACMLNGSSTQAAPVHILQLK